MHNFLGADLPLLPLSKLNHPRKILLVAWTIYRVRNKISLNGIQQWWQSWSLVKSNDYITLFRQMSSNVHFFHRSFCMGSSKLKPMLLEFPCFSLPIPRLRHSVAFCCPTSLMPSFFCLAKHSCCILLDMKTASREQLQGIKQNSVSSILKMFLNLFSSTFLTILNAWFLLLRTCLSSLKLLFH